VKRCLRSSSVTLCSDPEVACWAESALSLSLSLSTCPKAESHRVLAEMSPTGTLPRSRCAASAPAPPVCATLRERVGRTRSPSRLFLAFLFDCRTEPERIRTQCRLAAQRGAAEDRNDGVRARTRRCTVTAGDSRYSSRQLPSTKTIVDARRTRSG